MLIVELFVARLPLTAECEKTIHKLDVNMRIKE
jgi:hypothetical protein